MMSHDTYIATLVYHDAFMYIHVYVYKKKLCTCMCTLYNEKLGQCVIVVCCFPLQPSPALSCGQPLKVTCLCVVVV